MIYQKKSPKTRLGVRFTNENYDFVCKAAGELSLSAYVNRLVQELRQSGTTFCNSHNDRRNMTENTYVR